MKHKNIDSNVEKKVIKYRSNIPKFYYLNVIYYTNTTLTPAVYDKVFKSQRKKILE